MSTDEESRSVVDRDTIVIHVTHGRDKIFRIPRNARALARRGKRRYGKARQRRLSP